MQRYRSPLVGRHEEVAEVVRVLRATGPEARTLLVTGAAGAGRTALLHEARRAAAKSGAKVLRLDWEVAEGAAGPEALADAVRAVLAKVRDGRVLARVTHLRRARAEAGGGGGEVALLAVLGDVLADAARHVPFALVVDDADRMPDATASALGLALRVFRPAGVPVVLTARPTLAGRPGGAAQLLAAADGVTDLPPLSPAEVGELVVRRLDRPVEPDLVTALLRALGPSAGSPGAVLSVLAALEDRGGLLELDGLMCLTVPDNELQLTANATELAQLGWPHSPPPPTTFHTATTLAHLVAHADLHVEDLHRTPLPTAPPGADRPAPDAPEAGRPETGPSGVGRSGVGPSGVGPSEPGLPGVGLSEPGPSEHGGQSEAGAADDGPPGAGPPEVDAPEADPPGAGAAETVGSEAAPSQVGASQATPSQATPPQATPPQVGASEAGPSETLGRAVDGLVKDRVVTVDRAGRVSFAVPALAAALRALPGGHHDVRPLHATITRSFTDRLGAVAAGTVHPRLAGHVAAAGAALDAALAVPLLLAAARTSAKSEPSSGVRGYHAALRHLSPYDPATATVLRESAALSLRSADHVGVLALGEQVLECLEARNGEEATPDRDDLEWVTQACALSTLHEHRSPRSDDVDPRYAAALTQVPTAAALAALGAPYGIGPTTPTTPNAIPHKPPTPVPGHDLGSGLNPGPGASLNPEAAPGPGLNPAPGLHLRLNPGPGAGPNPEAAPAPGFDLDPDLSSGPGLNPGPVLGSDLGSDSVPGPAPDPGPVLGSDLGSGSNPGSAAAPEPGPVVKAAPYPGPSPDAAREGDPAPGPDLDSGPGPGPGLEAAPVLDAFPGPVPGHAPIPDLDFVLDPGPVLGASLAPGPDPALAPGPATVPDAATGAGPGTLSGPNPGAGPNPAPGSLAPSWASPLPSLAEVRLLAAAVGGHARFEGAWQALAQRGSRGGAPDRGPDSIPGGAPGLAPGGAPDRSHGRVPGRVPGGAPGLALPSAVDLDRLRSAAAYGDLAGALGAVLGERYVGAGRSAAGEYQGMVRDYLAGRWDRALSAARRIEARGRGDGVPGVVQPARALAAEIQLVRGKLGRAREWLDLIPDSVGHPLVARARLGVRYWSGQGDEAMEAAAVEAAWRDVRRARADGLLAGVDRVLLRILSIEMERNDPEAVRRAAAEIEALHDEVASPMTREAVLAARGMAHGDADSALAAYELVRERGDVPLQVDCCGSLAEVGDDPGRWLAEATRSGHALGMGRPVRNRLGAAARRRNVSLPRGRGPRGAPDGQGGPAGSGGRNERGERDVQLIELVSDGSTNRQVAARLGCSEKTVEQRLTRLFRRTGCRSRAELAAAWLDGSLVRRGLLPGPAAPDRPGGDGPSPVSTPFHPPA
ncbi:AAA family ATPase [Streptomyces liangshanensis]|uniref:AAA family ATPase n=1 Tax=Streptomyces liangshanensis TaxID=2717324 RepID=A0A6G9GZE9_9ACTN|nr:AAA family ATPase [Streptomyces liangshanensis]QIQ03648.1 AAA family ATPase [Streptomyces liangshanensis]